MKSASQITAVNVDCTVITWAVDIDVTIAHRDQPEKRADRVKCAPYLQDAIPPLACTWQSTGVTLAIEVLKTRFSQSKQAKDKWLAVFLNRRSQVRILPGAFL